LYYCKDGRPVVEKDRQQDRSAPLSTALWQHPYILLPPSFSQSFHPRLSLSPYNRISPTTYLFTEHLMVKINYSWNAEMPNTGPHADNDRESVRQKERGPERERLGTVPRE